MSDDLFNNKSKKKEYPYYSSSDLVEMLRDRHQSPEWAFMDQVRNGTGFTKVTRTADAVAMSLWPSRGIHMHGFEIKISRNDWLTELKNPAKAEEIAQHCHFWWLVTSNESVAWEGELPKPWGLMTVINGKLKKIKEPDFNDRQMVPYSFLASVLRNYTECGPTKDLLKKEYQRGFDQGEKNRSWNDEHIKRDYENLKAAVKMFEDTSGVKIHSFNGPDIAKAVKLVIQAGYFKESMSRTKVFAQNLLQLVEDLEATNKVVDQS